MDSDRVINILETVSNGCIYDFLLQNNIEFCRDDEDDDMRGMAIAYLLSTTREVIITQELERCFPDSNEILSFLLESTQYFITHDLIDQLIETSTSHATASYIKVEVNNKNDEKCFKINMPSKVMKNSILIMMDQYPLQAQSIFCANKLNFAIIRNLPFGYHDWNVTYINNNSNSNSNNEDNACDTADKSTTSVAFLQQQHQSQGGSLFVTSNVYEFLTDCDHLFDCLIWGWNMTNSNAIITSHTSSNINTQKENGNNNFFYDDDTSRWTDELENALLELLVCANDELQTALVSWKPMLRMMQNMSGGGGGGDSDNNETSNLCDMIREDITKALSEHSAFAIGRLHQNVLQLVDTGAGFLSLPDIFIQAVHSFLEAKVNASPLNPLLKLITNLTSVTMPNYLAELNQMHNSNSNSNSNGNYYSSNTNSSSSAEYNRLNTVWQTLQSFLNNIDHSNNTNSTASATAVSSSSSSSQAVLDSIGHELYSADPEVNATATTSISVVTVVAVSVTVTHIDYATISAFHALRPRGMELVMPGASPVMMSGGCGEKSRNNNNSNSMYGIENVTVMATAAYLPILPLPIVMNAMISSSSSSSAMITAHQSTNNNMNNSTSLSSEMIELDKLVTYYSECLGMDVLSVGSLLGYQLNSCHHRHHSTVSNSTTYNSSNASDNSNSNNTNDASTVPSNNCTSEIENDNNQNSNTINPPPGSSSSSSSLSPSLSLTPLADTQLQRDAQLILTLLNVGLEYVTSEGGKLMSMMHMNRAVLILNKQRQVSFLHKLNNNQNNHANSGSSSNSNSSSSVCSNIHSVTAINKQSSSSAAATAAITKPLSKNLSRELEKKQFLDQQRKSTSVLPLPLQKRRKDMPRVFRNKVNAVKGDVLSLKLNTDFDLALLKLRTHHGSDCWVGPALEEVWRSMVAHTPPQLLIFELWYNGSLVAADFSHPCANFRSVYVATRFFDRDTPSLKQLQAGFVLALVETRWLQRHGVELWDLGGVDSCPLMVYKYDLTGTPLTRPQSLALFRGVRCGVDYSASETQDDDHDIIDEAGTSSNTKAVAQITVGSHSSSGVTNATTRYNLSNVVSNTVLIENITIDDLLT